MRLNEEEILVITWNLPLDFLWNTTVFEILIGRVLFEQRVTRGSSECDFDNETKEAGVSFLGATANVFTVEMLIGAKNCVEQLDFCGDGNLTTNVWDNSFSIVLTCSKTENESVDEASFPLSLLISLFVSNECLLVCITCD